jgi:hypothetical protein
VGQIGVAQVRAAEVRPDEDRVHEIRADEDRPSEVGLRKVRASEVRLGEERLGEVGRADQPPDVPMADGQLVRPAIFINQLREKIGVMTFLYACLQTYIMNFRRMTLCVRWWRCRAWGCQDAASSVAYDHDDLSL